MKIIWIGFQSPLEQHCNAGGTLWNVPDIHCNTFGTPPETPCKICDNLWNSLKLPGMPLKPLWNPGILQKTFTLNLLLPDIPWNPLEHSWNTKQPWNGKSMKPSGTPLKCPETLWKDPDIPWNLSSNVTF